MAKKINQLSGMPQMTIALQGWTKLITLEKITQTIVQGLVAEVATKISFQGTIQPLSPKQIALKPEGQRDWSWLQIHCFSTISDLQPNDKILYNAVAYKIMATNDYSLNNYIEYHLVQDFQGS